MSVFTGKQAFFAAWEEGGGGRSIIKDGGRGGEIVIRYRQWALVASSFSPL